MANLMRVNGRDLDSNIKYLEVGLADEFKEVRGFGQLVTAGFAKKMAKDYFDDIEEAQKCLSFLETQENIKVDDLKNRDDYKALKGLLNPEMQVVSGVFGKEVILQVLSQKHCEGIRYIIGKDEQGKITVILIGVQEVENLNNDPIAPSEPVGPKGFYLKEASFNAIDPLNVEVHVSGKTIADMQRMFGSVQDPVINNDAGFTSPFKASLNTIKANTANTPAVHASNIAFGMY